MAHSFLVRRLLPIAGIVILLSGCGTAPVAERPSQIRDPDVLYVKAREAYRSGDYFLAAEHLIVLARRGDARGQYALGYLYYQGQGVLGDRARAMELFRLAAAQGNGKAAKALALLSGRGGAQTMPAPAPRVRPPEAGESSTAPVEAAPAAATPTAGGEPPESPSMAENEPADSAMTAVPQAQPESQPQPAAAPAAPEPSSSAEVSPPTETSVPAETATPPPEEVLQSAGPTFSAEWLRRQGDNQFTIQLVAGSSRKGLERFAQRQQLPGPVGVVETRLDGGAWYVVLYGMFSDLSQARDALQALPQELRRDRPWIRPLRDVVASLPAP